MNKPKECNNNCATCEFEATCPDCKRIPDDDSLAEDCPGFNEPRLMKE